MLTDMAPTATAPGQFYGSQIQTMGIANIAPHIQKAVSIHYGVFNRNFFYQPKRPVLDGPRVYRIINHVVAIFHEFRLSVRVTEFEN